MGISAHEACHHLLHQLRLSNLHVVISETPYSAQIMLRKLFLKEITGPSMKISSSSTFTKESQENDCLRNQIQQLESNINSSKETIDILEEKISKVESAALKSYEEKSAELAKLRNLVKGLNIEVASNKKDLNQRNKTVQEKEKEILKLNQKCTNLATNASNFKSEINTLKQENQILVKQKAGKFIKSHNAATNTSTFTLDESTSPDINFNSSPSIPSTSLLSRVGCTVSKNRSFGLQSSTFRVLCEMQWRIRFCNFFLFSKFFSYQELRAKKGGAPLKVKIFFSTDVWFMVLKRSVLKKQKQSTKNFNDLSYGYGAIHENVPKLRNCTKRRNFGTFS